jgi:hypothetical protein
MNKLITFYSDSHKQIYEEYFFPSFLAHLSKNYKLFPFEISQVCPSGNFNSYGFDETMYKKIQIIIDNIDLNDENYLVFSDCDVQFFSDLEFDMSNKDILFQQDYPNYKCAGFFICKQSIQVLNFFRRIKDEFDKLKNGKIDDQYIINNITINDIEIGFLSSEKYWSVGNATIGKVWDGEDFETTKQIIVHHANYTIGVSNKIKLMELVKDKISKQ